MNSLPCSKFYYFLFRRNPPSHIPLLNLAFFCPALTPTLSTYTMGSTKCNGQGYTAVSISCRIGTRKSHKKLSKILATTSTKWSYGYHTEWHTSRLYSPCLLSLPLSLSIHVKKNDANIQNAYPKCIWGTAAPEIGGFLWEPEGFFRRALGSYTCKLPKRSAASFTDLLELHFCLLELRL